VDEGEFGLGDSEGVAEGGAELPFATLVVLSSRRGRSIGLGLPSRTPATAERKGSSWSRLV
jgi:hypothetical protein